MPTDLDPAEILENKFELAKAKTADGPGTSYPAGLAFSANGKFLYVVEDVGDRLAVGNAATGEIMQRFSTDHYPYGVALTKDGLVFVSAWGGSTVSQFRVLADGTLEGGRAVFPCEDKEYVSVATRQRRSEEGFF